MRIPWQTQNNRKRDCYCALFPCFITFSSARTKAFISNDTVISIAIKTSSVKPFFLTAIYQIKEFLTWTGISISADPTPLSKWSFTRRKYDLEHKQLSKLGTMVALKSSLYFIFNNNVLLYSVELTWFHSFDFRCESTEWW